MRVLVVDDHPLVRKGIMSVLKFVPDMEEIQEASSVDEALSLLIKTKPEMTIIDINLGKEDGLEVIRKARKCNIMNLNSSYLPHHPEKMTLKEPGRWMQTVTF